MPKFFIFSDCHGFYNELKTAIDESGFDSNNKDHWLIGLGDYMDRGRQPLQIIDYLNSITRKILIKGNHEILLMDLLKRKYPSDHDYSNGTFDTVLDLDSNMKIFSHTFQEACSIIQNKVNPFINNMVNYFETQNYIMTHSFIPLINKDGLPAYYTENRKFVKMKNWRNASQKKWDESRWGNPFSLSEQGYLPEKTLIFGHWSVEHKWAEIEQRKDFDKNAHFNPYYGKGYIGIDATTCLSHKVNILIVEDDFLER